MAKLPPNTPAGLILIANLAVVAVIIGLGLFAKSIDWRYVVGFVVGYFFVYFTARIVHGVWLFNGD